MDPNSALHIIREATARCLNEAEHAPDGQWARDAHAALEEVAALDEWLRAGGFLPHDWHR